MRASDRTRGARRNVRVGLDRRATKSFHILKHGKVISL